MKNISAYFENALTFFRYYVQLYSPKRVSAKFIPIFFANRIRHYLYVRPHQLYFKTKSRREDRAKISIIAIKQENTEGKSFRQTDINFCRCRKKDKKTRMYKLIRDTD